MDVNIRDNFMAKWKKYFNDAELPLTFYYTDSEGTGDLVQPGSGNHCIIAALLKARGGTAMRFNAQSIGCPGGKRYAGFATQIMPNFEYFLSCGIPGRLDGERYKKSPEIVRQTMENAQPFTAPAPYIVFKRWDLLDESDRPQVVIFFAKPDVLSGLFTLAGFDETGGNSVISPFGSGCSSIIHTPYMESLTPQPRASIGMFDPSARPYVGKDELSFSLPLGKFLAMAENMDESFLITGTWHKVQKRI